MKRFSVETAVGLFLVAGFLCFAWLSVKLGNVEIFGGNHYSVEARFSSISGLKDGSSVEIAGVKVGKVAAIRLDPGDFEAVVTLELQKGVNISQDSIASIRTAGIIGDRYVDISPGGSDQIIGQGGNIEETESAINLETLISKYIFEKK